VLVASAMIEHHTAADHKGVLVQQRVWDALRVIVEGLKAGLTLG